MKEINKCPTCGKPVHHEFGRVFCQGFPIRCLFSQSFEEERKDFDNMIYLVYDVETTGRSTKQDYITEIGAILMKGEQKLGTFQSLVKPLKAIPQNIVKKTNITNDMVHDAKRFDVVFEEFKTWIDDLLSQHNEVKVDYAFAHNAGFDYRFTMSEIQRNGLLFVFPPLVDTLKMARKLIDKDKIENYSQPVIADYFKVQYGEEGAHRAEADVIALGGIIQHLAPIMKQRNLSFDDFLINQQTK